MQLARTSLGDPPESQRGTVSTLNRSRASVGASPHQIASRVPAPFPVALPRRFIELYTFEGDLVLDPFMGSGSTAVAAVEAGRRYVGYETDPAYVALAEGRLAGIITT